jgi:hypothetical protein
MNRDEAENLWGRGRADSKRLKPDDFQLTGVANIYLIKVLKDGVHQEILKNLKYQ